MLIIYRGNDVQMSAKMKRFLNDEKVRLPFEAIFRLKTNSAQEKQEALK